MSPMQQQHSRERRSTGSESRQSRVSDWSARYDKSCLSICEARIRFRSFVDPGTAPELRMPPNFSPGWSGPSVKASNSYYATKVTIFSDGEGARIFSIPHPPEFPAF